MPGIGLAQAFVGEILAIGVLTALTVQAALPGLGPWRRTVAAIFVAVSYLGASYFAQGAFKEPAEALFVLAFAVALRDPGSPARRSARAAALRPPLPRARRRHPLLLQLRRPRLAGRDRRPLEPDPAGGAQGPGSASVAALPAAAGDARWPSLALAAVGVAVTLSAPSALATASTRSPAATPTAPSRRSRRWGSGRRSNYRLDAPGGAELTGLAGAIGVLAVLGGRRLVGAPARARRADRARRLRRPLPRSRCRSAATTRRPRR